MKTRRAIGFAFPVALVFGACSPRAVQPPTDAGTGAAGDSAGTSPDTVTLTLEPFSIPAGAEVYKCQDFASPFGAAEAEIKQFDSHMTPGSHHLILFYKPGAQDSALADCSGLEFAASPYGSQRPDDSLRYPDGVAALVPALEGLRLQVHYVNATQKAIDAKVQVVFHRALPGSVTDHAGVFFFNNAALSIPPNGQPVTVEKTCSIPSDIQVILASSHMHMHGTAFTANANGTMIYQTNDWSEPKPAEFAPPLSLKAGSTVTFRCTYVNNSGQPLTFGESAITNEMCIFSGQFYPAAFGFTCL